MQLVTSDDGSTTWIGCLGGALTVIDDESESQVTHTDLSARSCLERATSSLLGFQALLDNGLAKLDTELPGGQSRYMVDANVGDYTSFAIDTKTLLPRDAITRTGERVEWTYHDIANPAAPPVAPTDDLRYGESYRPLDIPAITASLGLVSLPESVNGLALETAFEYDANTGTGPAFYVIWAGADRQVQLVLNRGAPVMPPGIEDLGGTWVLRVNTPRGLVQLFAPDRSSLERAVEVIEPAWAGSSAT